MCIVFPKQKTVARVNWLFVMRKNSLVVTECAWCGHHVAAQDVDLLQRAQKIHDSFCRHKRYVMSA